MVVDPRMATTQVSTPAAGDHKRAVSQVTADVPPIASVNETATVAKRGPPKRAWGTLDEYLIVAVGALVILILAVAHLRGNMLLTTLRMRRSLGNG